MTLHKLQSDFIDYIKTGDISGRLENEIEDNAIATKEKMDIYKNNVFSNAIGALENNFPYLQKLVGEEFFNDVSTKYAEDQLPESGSLAEYGNKFGQFLSTLDNVSGYEFIPDFARMEWAIHSVGRESSESYIAPQDLAKRLESNKHIELGLIDNAQILSSDYNLKYIYDLLNSEDDNEVDHDKLEKESKYLIRKADDAVQTFLLSNNEFWVVNSIQNGVKFQAAIEMISSEEEASTIVARLLNFKIIKEIK